MVCTDTRMNRWPRTAFGQFTIPSNRTSSLPLVSERAHPGSPRSPFLRRRGSAHRLVHEFFPRFVPPFFEVPFRALHETRFREPCKFHGRATAAPVGRKASFVPTVWNHCPLTGAPSGPQFSFVVLSRFRIRGYANLRTLLFAQASFAPVNVNNMFNAYVRNNMHDERT